MHEGRTFALGDCHGAYKALMQCLDRSEFDYKNDRLIVLGDVVDGWPESPEVIEELMRVDKLVYILGNHDWWCQQWLIYGKIEHMWDIQGGRATIDAYVKKHGDLMTKHRDHFFNLSLPYFIDEENRMYTHGGFNRRIKLEAQTDEMFMWDRSLADKAVSGATSGFKVDEFEHVFVGHTSVNYYSEKRVPRNLPFTSGNVTLLDTGAGWEGKLTIMNVDTKEFFQSDIVSDLYPDHGGRMKTPIKFTPYI